MSNQHCCKMQEPGLSTNNEKKELCPRDVDIQKIMSNIMDTKTGDVDIHN